MSLPSARWKALTISTTIALRSLAGVCGVFDTAMEKIPPDIPSRRGIDRGGSLASVRDWPMRSLSSCSSTSSSASSSASDSDFSSVSSSPVFRSNPGNRVGGSVGALAAAKLVYPHTPPESDPALNHSNNDGVFASSFGQSHSAFPIKSKENVPCDVPRASAHDDLNAVQIQKAVDNNYNGKTNFNSNSNAFHGLATPPLTPDDTSPMRSAVGMPFNNTNTNTVATAAGVHAAAANDSSAADMLLRLFPGSVRMALSYAKSVRISSSELAGPSATALEDGFAFEGIILDIPGHPRTLYIDGKGAENVKLRESIVALLDLASEHLDCSALVIALERSNPALKELLHSFLYVGASVVTKPPYPLDSAYVLVGIEC